MKVTIIYDNTSSRPDLQADWGFACLVETATSRILFDTGADGDILLGNMKQLQIDPQDIDDLFISHNHFDHTGGMSAFLNQNSDVRVIVPDSLRGVRKAKEVVLVKEAQSLGLGINTTGVLEQIEQSLTVETDHGLVLIVGCSHPDMENILGAASQFGNLYAIIGGMHGFNRFDLFKDLRLICPTHCTQHQQEIRALYPERCLEGGAGIVIEIE